MGRTDDLDLQCVPTGKIVREDRGIAAFLRGLFIGCPFTDLPVGYPVFFFERICCGVAIGHAYEQGENQKGFHNQKGR